MGKRHVIPLAVGFVLGWIAMGTLQSGPAQADLSNQRYEELRANYWQALKWKQYWEDQWLQQYQHSERPNEK